jgi:hypothetical protein
MGWKATPNPVIRWDKVSIYASRSDCVLVIGMSESFVRLRADAAKHVQKQFFMIKQTGRMNGTTPPIALSRLRSFFS